MILELKKVKSVSVFTFSPSICYEVIGLDAMILVFLMLYALFEKKYIKSKFSKLKAFLKICFSQVTEKKELKK